jgi:hypothetical protein
MFMKTPAALFPIVLVLGAIILAPRAGAQAQETQEGPIEIEKCRTIDQPGSYKLVNNLTLSDNNGTCLLIKASLVTIDLGGFTISGPPFNPKVINLSLGILGEAPPARSGITVRNGSISGFDEAVLLEGQGSIVEGVRVFGSGSIGIVARGVVKDNTVFNSNGEGFDAGGTVIHNFAFGNTNAGILVDAGSTAIGNTADNNGIGIDAFCPSNLTDNTAVSNSPGSNLVLENPGCNNTNNVTP